MTRLFCLSGFRNRRHKERQFRLSLTCTVNKSPVKGREGGAEAFVVQVFNKRGGTELEKKV